MCCGRYTFRIFHPSVSPLIATYHLASQGNQDQLKERTLLSWLASTLDMFFCFFSRLSFAQAYT